MPPDDLPSSAAAFSRTSLDRAPPGGGFRETGDERAFILEWQVAPIGDLKRVLSSGVFVLASGVYASSFVAHNFVIVLLAATAVVVGVAARLLNRTSQMKFSILDGQCSLSKPAQRAMWSFPLEDLQTCSVQERFSLRTTSWQIDFALASSSNESVALVADFASAAEAAAVKAKIDAACARLRRGAET